MISVGSYHRQLAMLNEEGAMQEEAMVLARRTLGAEHEITLRAMTELGLI